MRAYTVRKTLKRSGLTNSDSLCYGETCTKDPKSINFALCCKTVYKNVNRNNCRHCGYALRWQNYTESIANKRIKDFES